MVGIFSSCIISTRPGLSSSRSFVKGENGRTRESGSCIRNSSYSSGSSRTESSYDSIYFSDRTIQSIHSRVVPSQESDVSSNNSSTVAATARSTNHTATSRGFYANKENNAMIFFNEVIDDRRNTRDFGRRRKQRQYQPSRSPSTCEWGYFVDTA